MQLREILAANRLFDGLPPQALDQLTQHCRLQALRGGSELLQPDSPVDALYLVASGRLRVHDAGGHLLAEITAGESVGEIGLFARRAEGVSVRAARDCVLLRIDRDDFLAFAEAHPASLFQIIDLIVHRLSRAQRTRTERRRGARVIAVVPAQPSIDVQGFVRQLSGALGRFGAVQQLDAARVDADLGEGQAQLPAEARTDALIDYLNHLETGLGHGRLIYCADADSSAWSRRCMRQSDCIVLLARADDPPVLTPMVADWQAITGCAPTELVLLREPSAGAGDVAAWYGRLGLLRLHHFVSPSRPPQALARRLAGRALGLVLGGGGARGFAHIGLLRALDELELPVDLTAGSSMGAFFGAQVACGFDYRQVLEVTRETFVTRNYLNDYTLPRVSLIRGRKFLHRLQEVFGPRTIESLWKPFFCVTTNLTHGTACVHDRGPLALWVGTSMAVPGVAPPVAWHGDLHADGAVINSLPTDVLHALACGPVIASDVSTRGAIAVPGIAGPAPEALLHQNDAKDRIGLLDILFRTATLTGEAGDASRKALADCSLRMPVDEVGLFEWQRLDELAERGYRHALAELQRNAVALGL
ncbi:MAG: patatin-like phospholipase family protein [Gammaproteobacteria bacterium]|nr:patatin-like phospholipase family protein [Gammaproteobacteria bacterium]